MCNHFIGCIPPGKYDPTYVPLEDLCAYAQNNIDSHHSVRDCTIRMWSLGALEFTSLFMDTDK